MTSLRLNLGLVASLAAAACLGASPGNATPIITTFTEYTPGPVTNSGGPVMQNPGDPPLTSTVTTTDGASRCSITGTCTGGAITRANAVASQRNTVFGVFSGLVADGTFFSGGSSISTLTSRTTWQESPTTSGPNAITLFIKPGELALVDFASISFSHNISAHYRIELRLNGNLVFFSDANLQGGAGGPMLTESGTDLGGTFFSDVDFPQNVAGYRFDP